MTLAALAVIAGLSVLVLGACGQKGPLTLTPQPSPKSGAANPPPAQAPGAASAPLQR
ncbi:MAG: LPS translocon maturation chaperone LptM [Rubrivivax sp.]